jgi:hypothetical protein
MSNELSFADPDVWLVEFTNEQMAAFWEITGAYEEDTFGNANFADDSTDEFQKYRAELRSLQSAVEAARPIWEQSPTAKEQ